MNPSPYYLRHVTLSILTVIGMVLLSHFTHFHEFFFPELLALLIGCLWMGKRPWHTSRLLLFLSLSVGSWMGYGLINLPEISLIWRMMPGYLFCGLWLSFWKINITPMLAACLLPQLLGEATWRYPVAITSFMLIICGLESLTERWENRPKPAFIPLENPQIFFQFVRWSILACFCPC